MSDSLLGLLDRTVYSLSDYQWSVAVRVDIALGKAELVANAHRD